MDNIMKMVDFIGDLIYAVFDFIWKIQLPGTHIQLIFVLFVNLMIDLMLWFILNLSTNAIAKSKNKYQQSHNANVKNWGND